MRAALAAAVAKLFESQADEPPEHSEDDEQRLVNLAVLVVKCRSAVERDGYTREIELVPDSEAPTRLAIVLSQLLDGLLTLGADPATAWRVVEATAFDSIPALRRKAMSVLVTANRSQLSSGDIAEQIGYPQKTTERTLDELVAHGIADVNRYGAGKTTTWQISEWAAQNYAAATSPEMAEGLFANYPPSHKTDLSGEVTNGHRGDLTDTEPQTLVETKTAPESETV
jgi:DNA-binding transcriptional ArsR family regulator